MFAPIVRDLLGYTGLYTRCPMNILSTEEKLALKESAGLLYTSGQLPLFDAALPLSHGRRILSAGWTLLTWFFIGGIGVLLGLGLSLR